MDWCLHVACQFPCRTAFRSGRGIRLSALKSRAVGFATKPGGMRHSARGRFYWVAWRVYVAVSSASLAITQGLYGRHKLNRYLGNLWIRIGLVLAVFGWGPLLAIILLAAVGLWPDPNPNPIGPGLLFFFTAWPAIISLVIGIFQVRRRLSAGETPTGSMTRRKGARPGGRFCFIRCPGSPSAWSALPWCYTASRPCSPGKRVAARRRP